MSKKTEKEYTIENLLEQRKSLEKVLITLHNKFGDDDTDVGGVEDDVENALDSIESAIIKIDCKIDELTNIKVVCDNCGDKITSYPHNGFPLIKGDVCDTCNHIVVFHRILCAIDPNNQTMNFQQVCELGIRKE